MGLIPLLIWLLLPDTSTSEPFDCRTRGVWGPAKKAYCCANYGVGCPTTNPITPPTPKPTPPFQCQCQHRLRPLRPQDQLIHGIAPWTPSGSGALARRHGVAHIMARAAPTGAVAGRQSHPMIAAPASGIGNTVGLWRRKHGVPAREQGLPDRRRL